MNRTQTHTRLQRPNSEQLDVNGELFCVMRMCNISIQGKVQLVQYLFENNPQPDINAQDGNDNFNTPLHLAIERNELELVHFLLSQRANISIVNGDGKTPLDLAEECNLSEITDVLKRSISRVDLPSSETDRSVSHTSQTFAANPSHVSVLESILLNEPLFSCTLTDILLTWRIFQSTLSVSKRLMEIISGLKGLSVDKNLKFSNNGFKEIILQTYANKQLSAIDQLKATLPYPTPHVLAQFASMAYADCNCEELVPPNGWQLLTTASNCGINNGYFGIAYWHPEYQQVVIAHRADKATNFGALLTYVKGIQFNNYVQQMNSASTFANKVVTVLQEIYQEKKVDFELFFTGHSLGGWLAQITTFTTEYLEEKGGTFFKNLKREDQEPLLNNSVQNSHDGMGRMTQNSTFTINYIKHITGSLLKKVKGEKHEPPGSSTAQDTHNSRQIYHPHTVVFDSPGCKDMLSKMISTHNLTKHKVLEYLDITSYLSAPNHINTCNLHLGTIYRVRTNLKDLGSCAWYSFRYNIGTHQIGKFVDALDPKTAQVQKDNKGESKLREVVGWPVGFKELRYFFIWGKHYNNYDPVLPEGENRTRYQTKDYDECAKSLNVFTKDQQKFLKHYFLFRLTPEFWGGEKLFSELRNAEAEKKSQEMLENFVLDKDRIRCQDTSTLHALIPYVKRLVGLFPVVKEKLLSLKIRNKICDYETWYYVEKIDQSGLDFNPDALPLKEFLNGDRQIWHLQMVDGDAWTGITMVYRVLQKTSDTRDYCSEGHYTILKLDSSLLKVKYVIKSIETLETKETPYLLMIACETKQTNDDELRDSLSQLSTIMKQMNNMKIILTTKSKSATDASLNKIAKQTFGEGLITTTGRLTWSYLTASSQTAILKKTVVFQGRRVALNQLTSAESMTDSIPLVDLLEEKEITVSAEHVPSAGRGYNKNFYIGSSLDKLQQQAENQKVMIIAATVGMGKSTVLTHLTERIKQNYPAKWLVRIDLNDYTEIFKVQKGKKMDKERVFEFISKEVLKLKSPLEKELFKKSFEANEINKVVVMVDGFDETSPNYTETVTDMLQDLKQISVEQLWVTTRPHLREELEEKLQQQSYTLQLFSEDEQVEFIQKFWTENANIEITNKLKLQIYAEAVIRHLTRLISDTDKDFTGIPLHTRMLAEAFQEDFISFYMSEKSEPELPHNLDLVGLCRLFIQKKYDIYFTFTTAAGSVGAEHVQARDFIHIHFEHQLLALEALFTKDQVQFLQIDGHCRFLDERLDRIGIVQRNNGGKPQFISRTFAVFYVAEYITDQLTERTKQCPQVQDVLLNVSSRTVYPVTMHSLNRLLKNCKQSLRVNGENLNEEWNVEEVHRFMKGVITALLQSSANDNVYNTGLLIKYLESWVS